jgi:hypothetical protein
MLPGGKVLLVGGMGWTASGNKPTRLAELYDPAAGTFSLTGQMLGARAGLTATLISGTQVLVTGGQGSFEPGATPSATAELYTISTGTFSLTGSMTAARAFHTATLLSNGKVLVAGGAVDIPVKPCPADPPAELYDPTTGHFTATGQTLYCRSRHHAVLLSHDHVLLVGGGPMVGSDQDRTMEVYWP